MRLIHWRSLAGTLLAFQHSDRPWQFPCAAAVATGLPMAVGAFLELPHVGSLGAVAGLSFLYLPPTSLQRGIPIIMACAFGMTASYALGLAGGLVPGAAALLITSVATAAMLFCKTQALVPPGPLFMVIAASIGAFAPVHASGAVQNLGYFVLGCIWASAVAVTYRAYISRRRMPPPPRSSSRTDLDAALIDSILTGLFVGVSLALATMLDLGKAYWVPVSCLAVMQGMTLQASLSRNIHRVVGTIVGIGLTWLLVPLLTDSWAIAAAVTFLTFVIETTVVRHYAFAAIFITPLTILLAESGSPVAESTDMLMQARVADTIVGAPIGLIGAVCLHSRHVRRVVESGLMAIMPRKSQG